jgi:hypothetical protein
LAGVTAFVNELIVVLAGIPVPVIVMPATIVPVVTTVKVEEALAAVAVPVKLCVV